MRKVYSYMQRQAKDTAEAQNESKSKIADRRKPGLSSRRTTNSSL